MLYLFKKDIKRHPDIKRTPNRYDVDALHQLAALTAMAQTEERHRQAMCAGRAVIDEPGGGKAYINFTASETYRVASWTLDVTGDIALKFKSIAALLTCLGRAPNNGANYKSLRNTLRLWEHLWVRYRRWREGGTFIDMQFEPFIKKLTMPETGRGPVIIRLSRQFMKTIDRGNKHYVKVPLPLALSSEAALNMSLFLPLFPRLPDLPRTCPANKLKPLCDKLGISGEPRNLRRRLKATLDAVNRHQKKIGPGGRRYRIKRIDAETVRFVAKRSSIKGAKPNTAVTTTV